MAIYVTGDCHRDYKKFTADNFPEQKEMTKDDYVIILGDFGYWDKTKTNDWWMNWLEGRPFTTLFVDGNHENYDMLAELPVEEWNGGRVQKVRDSVIHLMRGEIYTIEGLKFFAFGGARSHDIQDGILEPDDPDFKAKKAILDSQNGVYRINHVSWWEEEMPSDLEMQWGLYNLEDNNNEVDYILTHDGPHRAMASVYPGWIRPDKLSLYFDALSFNIKFKRWFFGHHHENRNILYKYTLLYEQIIRIN
jgi:predicted phosphodiesterase